MEIVVSGQGRTENVRTETARMERPERNSQNGNGPNGTARMERPERNGQTGTARMENARTETARPEIPVQGEDHTERRQSA